MVYVRDDGVFDASIDKIWKYLQDPESHQHESILSQKVLEQKGNTMKIRAEIAGPQGKAEEIWQMRMDPPFGFELQVLEGPSKGSKQTHTYVPMADKTKVIDRKSTRLNSSHLVISYAVFCLKKKKHLSEQSARPGTSRPSWPWPA